MHAKSKYVKISIMKKIFAFTFAELMISLTIIAVITALLYPTISELAPNNNKHLFRAAYKTIEMTVQDIIDEEHIPGDVNADGTPKRQKGEMPSNAKFTCLEFQKRLNCANITAADAANDIHLNCGETGAGSDNGPQYLQTANGMRWIFRSKADGTIVINVDVNASNNTARASTYTYGERQQSIGGVPQFEADGVTPIMEGVPIEWHNGSFKGGGTMQDTFTVNITKTGQVSLVDGREHILNTTED